MTQVRYSAVLKMQHWGARLVNGKQVERDEKETSTKDNVVVVIGPHPLGLRHYHYNYNLMSFDTLISYLCPRLISMATQTWRISRIQVGKSHLSPLVGLWGMHIELFGDTNSLRLLGVTDVGRNATTQILSRNAYCFCKTADTLQSRCEYYSYSSSSVVSPA